MPLIMDDPLEQDGFDTAAAAAALGSQALDHDIDMGDLFGDDAAMAMPAQPPPRGLAARIVEMQGCGACQRIAWSRYGPIATIATNSKSLGGSALVFDQHASRWQLSKRVDVKLPEGYEGNFKHISWSFTGSDLAAIDASGRILIFGAQLGHSHLDLRGSLPSNEDVSDMGCIVGMHWLPPHSQAQKIRTLWSAQQEGDTWQWQAGEHQLAGPSNPIDGKSAFVAMSRKGRLRLLYQMLDNTWKEASEPVDDKLLDNEVFLTHASFAADKDDGLFMVTYDTRCTLRLYRITVDWGAQQLPPQDGQQQSQKTISPTINIITAKVVAQCFPQASEMSGQGDLAAFGAIDAAQYALTHLEMIPPSYDHDQSGQQKLCPSIITVFKNTASLLPALTGVPTPAPPGAPTIIWTWELSQTQQSDLSVAFNQLTAKKKSVAAVKPKQHLDLKHLTSTPFHNTILSVTPIRYNSILALALADGSVEFWKHDTMEAMQAEYNFSSVYSLVQSGFSFPAADPVLATALSPNNCCLVSLSADGNEPSLHTPENHTVNLADPDNAQQQSATVAVLALQLCGGMLQLTACQDDVYAVVQPHGHRGMQYEILELAYSALNITLAFVGEEVQKSSPLFFRSPWLQKLIGQQAVLGQLKDRRRSLSSKLSHVTLNIRHAAFVLMMVFRTDLALKADVALSLSNMVQWCLDLMIYSLQEIDRLSEHLFHLSSTSKSTQSGDARSSSPYDDRAAIEAFLSSENSPALLALLCSSSRMLLRMVCRPLRHGWIHCMNSEQTAATPQARAMFVQALSKFINSPICKQIPQATGGNSTTGQAATTTMPGIVFELFIQQVDAVVTATYKASGISVADRARVEKDMFIHAKIPEVLMPAVKRVLTDLWPKFVASPNVNLGAIYKHDISWLGLTEDRYTRQWQRKHVVDVVKKTVMMKPGTDSRKIRYCTRCGSGMEDIQPEPRWPAWVIGSMRNCICSGNWGEVEG